MPQGVVLKHVLRHRRHEDGSDNGAYITLEGHYSIDCTAPRHVASVLVVQGMLPIEACLANTTHGAANLVWCDLPGMWGALGQYQRIVMTLGSSVSGSVYTRGMPEYSIQGLGFIPAGACQNIALTI